MIESPYQEKEDCDRPYFYFIGQYVSPTEIYITTLPIFYDALQLTQQPTFIQDPSYQYLDLHLNTVISFHYYDGIKIRSGKIAYKDGKIQIIMEQPLIAAFNHLLVRTGEKLSFLTIPPNNKIKKRKKLTAMDHADTKEFEITIEI
jgi:hypothetical protein